MKTLKVQDIVDLNTCIEKLKASADQCLRIQSIPEGDLCWGTITDASYGNVRGGKSQGGFCVAYDQVARGERGKCNLIWKSSKIHRVPRRLKWPCLGV